LGTLGTPGTLSLWKWWLAPIAAGVTAATLWMVVPEQGQLATAPPQPSDAKAVQAPSAEPIPPSAPAKDKELVPEKSTDRLARDNKFAATAREDRPQEKPNEERKEGVAALQERAKLADAAAPAAPPAAAAPPPSAPARQAPAGELAALQKNAPRVIAPPGIEVIHQSAPSDSVCWFVGRAGLVLLTTDAGATFTRVDLAEPLDIASVSATDDRHATVSTVDGRRFRTEDGGRTWRPF
jgi:Photosynthesis system II assembly factor YCF48